MDKDQIWSPSNWILNKGVWLKVWPAIKDLMCCKTLLSLSNLKTLLTSSVLQSLNKVYPQTSLNFRFNKSNHRWVYCPANSTMSSSIPKMSPEPSMLRACPQTLPSVNWLISSDPLLVSDNFVSSHEKPKTVIKFIFALQTLKHKNKQLWLSIPCKVIASTKTI